MKTESKHTPGPWKVESGSWPRVICRSGDRFDGATIAEVYNGHENARLIAAAPELLEALQECAIALHKSQRYGPAEHQANILCALESAQQAIAKAEGSV